MKKLSILCVVGLSMIGIAGCGNHQQKESSKDSAKISSLKAENSSLKAKKRHKAKKEKQERRNTSASSDSKNQSQQAQRNQQSSNQPSNNVASGNQIDGRDPNIPASYYDEDAYRGSYKQNMTPQQRYDYDRWQVYYQSLTPEQREDYQNQMANQNQ